MNKKIKENFVFILIVLQIFLLVNLSFVESYSINNIDSKNVNEVSPGKKIPNIFRGITNFLVGFLSIRQIGLVSAVMGCCQEAKNGALCTKIDDSECKPDTNFTQNDCEGTDFCKTGWCYSQKGYCSGNSPEIECVKNGGDWSRELDLNCKQGCCFSGENTDYMTQGTCEWMAGEGQEINFTLGYPEDQCVFYSEDKGACTYQNGSCKFITEQACFKGTPKGIDFNQQGVYCSDINPEKYKKHNKTACIPGKKDVYWTDNFDNFEDIKTTCAEGLETCDEKNLSFAYCKSTSCKDENNKTRKNGESWCVYDGYVGDGKDLVGSTHWKRWCDEGIVEAKMCGGDYRGEICAEKKVQGMSMAQCRINLAPLCFKTDNKEDCEDETINPDCRWQEVNVDEWFKFSVCLPKYKEGFETPTQAEQICGVGTQECTIVESKKFLGSWHCDNTYDIDGETVYGNCQCEEEKFVQEMNNFCVSLGDCGAYPNYVGNGTNNFAISGQSYVVWEYVCKAAQRDVCSQETPGNDGWGTLGFLKTFCLRQGSCDSNHVYSFNEDLRVSWQDYLKYYNEKTNVIGENTPKYITWTEDVGRYGEGFELAVAGQSPDLETGLGVFDYASYGVGAAAIIIAVIPGVGWIVSGILAALSLVFKFFDWVFSTDYQTKTVKFTCLPWKAPRGGSECDKCNTDPLKPCTEYRCASLGRACKILPNTYNEDALQQRPICYSPTPNDTAPPIISPGTIQEGYKFVAEPGVTNGISIKTNDDGCITERQSLSFSLKTNEFAECRWSETRFSVLEFFENPALGLFKEGNSWSENHSKVEMPIYSSENVIRMYVRCVDPYDNINFNEYVVNICISQEADMRPPEILRTIPPNGGYLRTGVSEISLMVYLDEAGKCKYATYPYEMYENMTGNMICNDNVSDFDPKVDSWNCRTQVTNFIEPVYIRCNDTFGNVAQEDYIYTLKQTPSILEIYDISPASGTVWERPITRNNPLNLTLRTRGGVDEGRAICEYKMETQRWGDSFTETNSSFHKYKFTTLSNGNYSIIITCRDSVGNIESSTINLNVEADLVAPKIINNKTEGDNFIFETDEEALCYYRNDACPLKLENSTAIPMDWVIEHKIPNLDPSLNYYITCEDEWGNKNCSYTIKATELIGTIPGIVRVYYDKGKTGKLIVMTDKRAICSYNTDSCYFEIEGSELTTTHSFTWGSPTYYIRCKDKSGKEPDSGSCTIVVKADQLIT